MFQKQGKRYCICKVGDRDRSIIVMCLEGHKGAQHMRTYIRQT